MRITLALAAATLLLAGAAQAAPANAPRPEDLTSTPEPIATPGANRPEDLTDRPPGPAAALLLPTVLKDRSPHATDQPAQAEFKDSVRTARELGSRKRKEHGSRAAVGRR